MSVEPDPNAWRADVAAQAPAWQHDAGVTVPYAPPPADPWAWWLDALEDRFGLFKGLEPQQGFYRCRPKMRERGQPCAIFYDGDAGRWWAILDGTLEVDVGWAWQWSHKRPCRQELHDAVVAGGAWPDEVPAPTALAVIGHNSADAEEVDLDAVQQLDSGFTAWLAEIGGAISTEEQDQRAEGYRARLAELRKAIDQHHEAARSPFVEAKKHATAAVKAADLANKEALENLRTLDARWEGSGSPIAAHTAAAGRVSDALTPYRVAREARRTAEAEALRAERAAADPVAYGPNTKAGSRASGGGNTVGRAKGTKPKNVLQWTDRAAFVAVLLSEPEPPPELLKCLDSIAWQRIEAKQPTPGVVAAIQQRA